MTVETGVLERYSAGAESKQADRGWGGILRGHDYGDDFIGIAPWQDKPGNAWCAPPDTIRFASETKGAQHKDNYISSGSCCYKCCSNKAGRKCRAIRELCLYTSINIAS